MNDRQCVQFLQWALPRLRLRWPGFRKVRRQVCKRIARRIMDLGLSDVSAYQTYLTHHPGEWHRLDSLCRITISRFLRDRGVFACLEHKVIPMLLEQALTRGDQIFRGWSAGCGSGEEPYTLAIVWQQQFKDFFPAIDLHIMATDVDPVVLERARRGCYPYSSLKGLPQSWRKTAFIEHNDIFCLRGEYRRNVDFRAQDIRRQIPKGPFDLVLCRNLVFTYFEEALQREILRRIQGCLHDGGALVLGKHEKIPGAMACGWQPWFNQYAIYRKIQHE